MIYKSKYKTERVVAIILKHSSPKDFRIPYGKREEIMKELGLAPKTSLRIYKKLFIKKYTENK